MSSQDFKVFELFATPLHDTQLIEASAGTGKTYTIAGLFLRLLLEGLHRVDQILVVTFTNAATEELKERIRNRLVQLRNALLDGLDERADPVLVGLLERLQTDHESALKRLENAIRGFDEAAIFTIHGFCQRVLADRAFASAMPFETELRADVREILQEIVEDFWRRRFYQASPLLVDYLLDQKYTPERLLREIKPYLGKPYLNIVELARPAEFTQAEQHVTDAYALTRALWLEQGVEIRNLLQEHLDQLNQQSYKQDKLLIGFRGLDDYLAEEMARPVLFNGLERFTTHKLSKSTKKNCRTPQHEFFDACERLWLAVERLQAHYQTELKALRVELLRYADQELARRKRREQIQSYDDLLLNLHRALQGPGGDELATQLRERYPAALIDEFQDTDPIQYAIFSTIYHKSGLPVFLVGDPKQAIYSFRGADIFAYLRAHEDARWHTTLAENWRSEPALIEAVNAVFQRPARSQRASFLLDQIDFYPVRPAEQLKKGTLQVAGDTPQALRFWFLHGPDSNTEKPLSKTDTRVLAATRTAAEIARLLNAAAQGQASVEGRPLHGGDIAVLVRKHDEGRQIREALLELGIASVQQTRASVFTSREAQDMYYLLRALSEPGREPLVRAALATQLIGLSGVEIYQLGEDDRSWDAMLERIQQLHRIGLEQGFVRMFWQLLREFNVQKRLLGLNDGERRLTNILHLMELLQQATQQQRLGPEGLAVWLAERLAGDSGDQADEEQQLRLESDSQLVQVLTVHKSKGLEYPIVFCPYLWDGRLGANDKSTAALSFHDPAKQYQAVLDLGSDQLDSYRPLAAREELAENLRLCYVALTRAKYRCYVLWGKIKEAENSALAWLLHSPPVIGPNVEPLQACAERVKKMTTQALYGELQTLASQHSNAICIAEPAVVRPYKPIPAAAAELQARVFAGPVRGRWQITSFSALVANSGGSELPDYDAAPWLQASDETPQSKVPTIFDFPRGARAGRCLHQLFEYLDFASATSEQITALTEQTLAQYGFDLDWTDVIITMVEQVLHTPLDSTGLCLAEVSSRQRLNELEFYYPLARLDASGLQRVLNPYLSRFGTAAMALKDELDRLDFAPTRGYMKGFIDLVFESGGRYYIIDYKSNWLGMQPSDYQPEQLAQRMSREGYVLQYLIYTIALHRYLQLRLPDYHYQSHFGGVFYLFLRGMDPNQAGCGVYADVPAADLIQALDEYLQSGQVKR